MFLFLFPLYQTSLLFIFCHCLAMYACLIITLIFTCAYFPLQFCITLNDIEHMRVELSRIPELLGFTSVDQSTSTLLSIHTMLINASEEIKHYSSLIVSYVGKQVIILALVYTICMHVRKLEVCACTIGGGALVSTLLDSIFVNSR